ncbi:MAG: ADP-ribosylglycohydrolase family protein [Saprospiraceae bacterium]|nr:ADP-ribosylglycohydrolase family protein [Lewinella sp.]
MSKLRILTAFTYCLSLACLIQAQTVEISAEQLRDKINGGIIGQFFGNLNGLIHENKYFEEPGNVEEYVPDLSDGAFTDDDTDIEFVYIHQMTESGEIMLPYEQIRELWTTSINEHIWCSNRYARNLMEIGFAPPLTGRIAFNPWAVFNISGQFLCEEFALISPGMPQTASRIGAHYTHVAIDGEPTQTTLLYDTMIATAFFEKDYMKIIAAGLAAVDPKSEIHRIVSDVISWYQAHPDDWRKTRSLIKDKYWDGTWGAPGGSNGYRTITAATIGALLHGKGDFVEAIRLAFNFGWDADNISAMVGTIMGVLKGEKWIRAQGWQIKDEYRNTRRPGLPEDLTITDFADLHYALAQSNILQNGGEKILIDGAPGFRIVTEPPKNTELLPDPLSRARELRREWWPVIQKELTGDAQQQARAVYAAICLELVDQIAAERPADWLRALPAIQPHYEALFGDDQWSAEAKHYFNEVVNNRNVKPGYPFGYGKF